MSTPVCPRIFSKIEDLNPEISINVWEWEEKTGIPKPVIASEAPQRVELPVKGPNATEEFIRRLDKELRRINDVLEVKVERIVTEEAKKEFTEAVSCWIFCESVRRSIGAHQIKVIAETFKRYKSIKVGQFKYIDSMQFMASSLANLAKNLGTDKPLTKRHFSSEHIDLITCNGVYPYEYIDSHDRFKETELPSIHDFHSTLGGKITQDNYKYAQKVWKEFGCKNLGEYHDLYLKTDVLLLTDVWTKFRQTAMHHYGLDPSHYVSAPALSWDGMLKITGVKIELFTNMTMHDFTEKTKRGGITMAGHRLLKTNNSKIGDFFNPSKPTTWISYNPDKQKQILNVILNTKPDATCGYFLNIKAHFPLKTYDYLQDLPPAVDSIAVKKDRLSPYITKLVDNLYGGRFPETEKLVPHLEDIYKDMVERPDLFDLNDIKTIGLFKNETPGNVITESYHIRAKSYHYVLADKFTKSKYKGISKKGMSDMAKDTYFPSLGRTLLDDTVEKDEIFDPITQVYRDCQFENNIFYAKNVGMCTKNHVISLIESEKKALSPIDTKR
ncbi:uncharacterized protein OCT59_019678 [Rhizophagus irregularis]|uniref:uncharacterized protein n=1 Tax=Rhizophagus irregularis TaxID=588596 RepID=UPI00332F374F|nr:hypothetical protein OCT59_019678 [Rhizophagus irregularis]